MGSQVKVAEYDNRGRYCVDSINARKKSLIKHFESAAHKDFIA